VSPTPATPEAAHAGAAPRWSDVPALLPWALGIAAGIVLNEYAPMAPALAVAAVVVAGATMAMRRVRRRWGIALALFAALAMGVLLHHRALRVVPTDDIVHYAGERQRLARVTGVVMDEPRTRSTGYAPFEPWLYLSARTTFLLAVDGVETQQGMVNASGCLRVTVKDAALQVTEGARIEAFGWLFCPQAPRNPGSFDWATFQRRRGVRAGLVSPRAECVKILEPGGDPPWWSRTHWRSWARRMLLDDRIESGGAGVTVLDAMVLGRRAGIDRNIEQAFIDTGCAHYLAVSGMHVGMLAAAIWLPARLAGWPKRRTAWLVMALVVAYALLADARPPIFRAAVMVVAYGMGIVLRRPRALVGALCLAAIVVLYVDPASVFDVGFQLSFAAVIGIVALQPVFAAALAAAYRRVRARVLGEQPLTPELERIAQLHTPETWVRRAGRGAGVLLSVGLAAWVSSLPIVAHGFGYVAWWGWFNSLVALPAVYIVMVTGFLRIAVGAVVPPLGDALDPVLNVAVGVLTALLAALAKLPIGRQAVPAPPAAWIVAYYLLLAVLAARVRGWTPRWTVAAGSALLVGATSVWFFSSNTPSGVRITQLAVGRGTSTVIELPDGAVWLYDAGASGSYDPGGHVIVPFLRQRGIRHIDGIVLSHANLDHFGGVPAVLDAIPCGPVYVAPQFEDGCRAGQPCAPLLELLRERSHPVTQVTAGDALPLGGDAIAEVLWPPADATPGMDVNEASLVMRIRYGENAILLTGDIESVAQSRLVERGGLDADVLVLPHHGAVEPTTRAFVAAVGADVLVRSTFVPTAESAALQIEIGTARLFNTADHGAIEVLLDGHGVRARGLGPESAGLAELDE